jgi:DNA helicase IV
MRRIEVSALSKQQEEAVMHPLSESVLVVGAPGTGKSVVLTQRAERAALMARRSKSHPRVLCVARQTPLMMAIRGRMKTTLEVTVETLGDTPDAAIRAGAWSNTQHVLVDEAQDFELQALESLCMIERPITATADDNQRTRLRNGPTRAEIVAMLSRNGAACQVFDLDMNYRNTPQIHAFASCFHFAKTTLLPRVGVGDGDWPEVIVTAADGVKVAELIAKTAQPLFGREIGVVVCGGSNREVETLTEQLKTLGLEARHFAGSTSKGDSSKTAKESMAVALSPGEPGVKVLGHRWVKGLEFDAVIALHFCSILPTPRNGEPDKTGFGDAYIVASRARSHLFLVERAGPNEQTNAARERVRRTLEQTAVPAKYYRFR